jgi:hypothetical protein
MQWREREQKSDVNKLCKNKETHKNTIRIVDGNFSKTKPCFVERTFYRIAQQKSVWKQVLNQAIERQ